jgi:hypothetical protein
MKTPAAITSNDNAKYDGCTTDLKGSGAADKYEQLLASSPRHSLITGNVNSTVTNVTKSATPAEDTIAPDLDRCSSSNKHLLLSYAIDIRCRISLS